MNRAFKFRIWNKHSKHFCGNLKKYLLNLQTSELEVANYSDLYEEWYYSQHLENDYIIQQYTGLKDRHGKEIYEGDIVTYQQPYRASRLTHPATTDSYRTIIAPVVYNQDNFTFEIDSYAFGTSMIKTRKDIEIVGNIFENSEILKL